MNKECERESNWVTIKTDIWAVSVQSHEWDKEYGRGNWRIVWQIPNKEVLSFEQLFLIYVDSYVKYFEDHYYDALFLTNHYAFVYSLDHISKKEIAFDPYAFHEKPGEAEQFHHTAINLALENVLGLEFKGSEPIGREEADFWHPNQIPPYHPDLIPLVNWCPTLETFYQKARKLQIKK